MSSQMRQEYFDKWLFLSFEKSLLEKGGVDLFCRVGEKQEWMCEFPW